MKTKAEVHALKTNWAADPIWCLAETEGFEEHADELQEYSNAMIEKWEHENPWK